MILQSKTIGMTGGLVLGFTLLLAGLVMFMPNATRAEQFTLQPLQPATTAGYEIEFAASGFNDSELISVWGTAPDQSVVGNYSVRASGDGQATIRFQVPQNGVGGRWALTAMGDYSRVPVVTYFEVQGRHPAPWNTVAAVQPLTGTVGLAFHFAATGFRDNEEVSYWVTTPQGWVYEAQVETIETNADGRIDFSWTPPMDAMSGRWVMTMQGTRSGVARGIPFHIAPHF